MITGSHNASEYNGLKLCVGKEALHGEENKHDRKLMEAGRFSSGAGTVSSRPMLSDNLGYLKKSFASVRADRLHVVIDCGNGAAALVAKEAVEQLGCRVTGLFCELDGRFPNHHPDPTVVDNLQDLIRTVKTTGADVGIGYDGDADRIGAVDEQGNILWGDRLMVVYSRDILASRPGSTIISEVKASQSLYDDIERHGGRPIMWKTGHSLIKAKMKAESAVLAGEMSGHMFFADRYFGFDDAIYASCRLVEILSNSSQGVAQMLSDVPPTVVTPEIRVQCDDDKKFEVVERVRRHFKERCQVIDVDGARILFPNGWGLVRASNTQDVLVLRFEAQDQASLKAIRAEVGEQVRRAMDQS